ncbi:MAG: LamG domain-containing protein [Planctomycetaceae bacterium]|nr:LamG domain-containing protein [Planctomycetaceae bacterium]
MRLKRLAIAAAVVVLACVCASQAATLGDGLVGYYKFDGNTADLTGNNPNGALTGTANISTADKLPGFGTGAADLGTSKGYGDAGATADHIEIAQPNDLSFGSGAFTVTFWMRWNDTQYGGMVFGTSSSGTGWRATGRSNGNLDFYYDTNTQAEQRLQNVVSPYGLTGSGSTQWIFVAMVIDPSAGKLNSYGGRYYQTTIGGTATTGLSSTSLAIVAGGSVDTTGPFLLGSGYNASFDELAIWNRALTAAEISQIYNTGHALDLTAFLPIPEPATMGLLLAGGLMALIRGRRRC